MGSLRAIKDNYAIPREEFADLVEMYSNSVYKFCRSLAYSKEDADDLFQETFLRAFEQQAKLSVSDNPQGFLFSVSLYIWKTWKRKHARRKRLAPTEPLDDSIAGEVNTEDGFMAQEETRIIRELVKALPDKFKIPVILYYTVEMSLPDIAFVMKSPVGTIKSRLFKARKLIGKGLVQYEK